MMSFFHNIHRNIQLKFFYYCIGLVLLALSNMAFSQTIKISPNTVISSPKTYENVNLDMSKGWFVIKNNSSLTIKNSTINGTLSKNTNVLFNVENGTLSLENNQVDIKTSQLSEHPLTQSLEYVIQIGLGGLNLKGNTFKIDHPFTAGLLITTSSIPSTGFNIINNKFEQFHGVLYLIASDNSLIEDNVFLRNSYGHIVIVGNNARIIHNSIFFAGNNRLGNSMDIIDSNNVTISKNLLFTPTCHGIYILNSHDLVIDSNRITGGITYAMNILSFPETAPMADKYVPKMLGNYKIKNSLSNNITITNNYMAQNRYGIAASDTDKLLIKNNVFIQRFEDNDSRKFWTNNTILLQKVTHLTWTNNLYKEAFSQVAGSDNPQSRKFIAFPETGGVTLQ